MDFYELGKKGTCEDIIKNYDPFVFNSNFRNILKGLNDRNDTDLLIRLSNQLVFPFYEICTIGIRPLINYIFNNNIDIDINLGLWGACKGGHRDIVDLLIENGANDWNRGLIGACESGHRDLVLLMTQKGAYNYISGILYALINEHCHVAEHLITLGAVNSMHKIRKANKKYYEYLSNKLNIHKSRSLELYEVLNDLVILYQ